MDDVRLIDAKKLETEILNWQNSTTSKAQYDAYENALNEVFDSPTVDPESPWREASCLPPTHVDEWDADGEHYRFDVSDEVWIFCSDGTRLLGRYDKQNGWFESNGPQVSSHNHGSVTHWMPLPEPPKGVA